MNKQAIIKNQQGTILLITILIMLGIIGTTITMAFIIINEIQQSRNIDYSIVAYYAAEAAVEQGLYEIRKVDDITIANLVVSSDVPLSNDASWQRAAEGTELQLHNHLPKNQSMTIDLYDPDYPTVDPEIKDLIISWDNPNPTSTVFLEITRTEWPKDLEVPWGSQPQYVFKTLASYGFPPVTINIDDSKTYQFRIKALYGDAEVTVTALDNGNQPQVIPGRAVITGLGSFHNSKQAVKVSLPRRAPLSGIFDYILFSDLEIVKN